MEEEEEERKKKIQAKKGIERKNRERKHDREKVILFYGGKIKGEMGRKNTKWRREEKGGDGEVQDVYKWSVK